MTEPGPGCPPRYCGRVALVVGGSRGIGAAIVRRIHAEGGLVVVTGRSTAPLNTLRDELGPTRVLVYTGNAADPHNPGDTVRMVMEQAGRLDLLVNNAAISPTFGATLDVPDDTVESVLTRNAAVPLRWIRACRSALAQDQGAIVNISSMAGVRSVAGLGVYGASKAALIRLSGQLAAELAPDIRVNCVVPGVVRTDLIRHRTDDQLAEMSRAYPLGRLGRPEDVAAAVAYLGSSDAAWVTGQALVVDGGLSSGHL